MQPKNMWSSPKSIHYFLWLPAEHGWAEGNKEDLCCWFNIADSTPFFHNLSSHAPKPRIRFAQGTLLIETIYLSFCTSFVLLQHLLLGFKWSVTLVMGFISLSSDMAHQNFSVIGPPYPTNKKWKWLFLPCQKYKWFIFV